MLFALVHVGVRNTAEHIASISFSGYSEVSNIIQSDVLWFILLYWGLPNTWQADSVQLLEWCLGAPLAVKPIRESSPRHQSLAHCFTSLFDSHLSGGESMYIFSMHTHFENDTLATSFSVDTISVYIAYTVDEWVCTCACVCPVWSCCIWATVANYKKPACIIHEAVIIHSFCWSPVWGIKNRSESQCSALLGPTFSP